MEKINLNKFKAVAFDFDGTLTVTHSVENCWRYVWKKIDKTDVDDALFEKFINGIIDSEQWKKEVIAEFRKNGVDRALIHSVADSLEKIRGIRETFSEFEKRGIKIFIISGGIKQIIEYCLGENVQFVDEIECEELVFDDSGLVCGINRTDTWSRDKINFIEHIKQKLNLNSEEILFVGNADNDEMVHQTGAVTLCINPQGTDPYNKNYWDFAIESVDNLKQIIDFFD